MGPLEWNIKCRKLVNANEMPTENFSAAALTRGARRRTRRVPTRIALAHQPMHCDPNHGSAANEQRATSDERRLEEYK